MTRKSFICGILALGFMPQIAAGIGCSISDWPLEMPQGTADFVRYIAPARAAVNPVVTYVTQSAPTSAMHAAPAANSPPLTRRDWNERRPPTPTPSQQVFYAIWDNDDAQVERLLKSAPLDLNASVGATVGPSLLNLAAGLGEPKVARVLIAHGAHVRPQPGDSIELHPVAEAVSGLEGFLNRRDRPDPFYHRPPQSLEGFLAVLHILLDAGADPNALRSPSSDLSALAHLVLTSRFAGDLDLVRLLVAHGADVDGPPPLRSALGLALDAGYDDYVAAMLGHQRVSVATLNHGLMLAIGRRNAGLGQTFLEAGADANFKDRKVPILCRALESADLHALSLALLAHGADASADCGNAALPGGTPLTVVDSADPELIDALMSHGAKLVVPVTDATQYLAHGVDPTPLNWALLHRRDHVASVLLAQNPAAAHDCGAVLYAARYGDAEALARLLALGADPNSTSPDGITALMAAAYHGEARALAVLLAQPGIGIDRATPSHFNPGHFRFQYEGRSPPLFDGSRTALMLAALGGSVDATSLLIAHGARLHIKDAEGLEAAQYASSTAVGQLLAGGAAPTPH